MTALLLAAVLAADGGLPDGGEYVVLDVNRGALWTNLSDGGVSDAPVLVHGGAWMDDDALMHNGKKEAFDRGALSVGPDVDVKTLTLVGAVLFAVGLALGLVGGWVFRGNFR